MFNTAVTHIVSLIILTIVVALVPPCFFSLFLYLAACPSLLYVSYLLATLVDNVLPRFRVKSDKKAVFITGCDTGFGHLLAHRLDSIGYKVFAGCLDATSEDTRRLKDTSSNNLHIVQVDVTQDDSVQKALRVVENDLGNNKLWAVVNNAGILEYGELEWMPMEAYRKQFEVNTFGVVRVTQAFLPLLRKSKGRVVTTTSTGGRLTFSGFAAYCMSKHATSSFCDGLRLEMKKFGVKVITVEPISYKTSMTEMSTVLQSAKNNWNKAPEKLKLDVYDADYMEAFANALCRFNASRTRPEVHQVVDCLVEGVAAISPHYSYVPGDARSLVNLWFVKRMPKTLVDYLVRKMVTLDCVVENYLMDKEANKKQK